MASLKVIVVLGATGQQGGAVARSLVADGRWRVRALSRSPDSRAARRLAAAGLDVVEADMDDPASLRSAFGGAYGVYSVQGTDQGSEVETRRGIAVADAARMARVQHFIYSSVGGADRRSGVPHFESKWRVEQHIRGMGLPSSIVRPVFFMDNFVKPALRLVLTALLRSYVPNGKPLQMIATTDIGKWVAHAFAHPDVFIGKAEEIAGDALTCTEIIEAFKRHGWSTGLSIPMPRLLFRPLPHDVRRMFEWFGEAGYTALLAPVAGQPDLLTLDAWLLARRALQSSA